MNKNYWTCPEDFEADMLSISDFCGGSVKGAREAPSSHTRKTRSKLSIYDDPPEEMEENINIRPGRGYPLVRKSGLRNPGGTPTFLLQQNQTTKEIRNACGGLVFSNDIIEDSLKSDHKQDVVSSHNQQMPNIRLSNSPTSDSSSKYSTPSSSPLLSTSSGHSCSGSPTLKHKQEVVVTDSKINPVSIYTQHGKPQGSCNTVPPPIYEMLRSRKSKPAEQHYARRAEKPKDNMADKFTPGREKSFNIHSNSDFPELR